MATGLLISVSEVKRLTRLDANLDGEQIKQNIELAQDVHIQNALGSDLYEKLQSDIVASTLTGVYSTLVNSKIKKPLAFWVMYELLDILPFTISNQGVFKHSAEAATPATQDEVQDVKMWAKNKAEYYTSRLVDFICANESDYPEYNTNTDGDVYPDDDAYLGGLYLD